MPFNNPSTPPAIPLPTPNTANPVPMPVNAADNHRASPE